jgi:hypothetical protein
MDLALPLVVVAPVAHVDVSVLGFDPAPRDDPIHRALERVAVIGIALQGLCRQRTHPPFELTARATLQPNSYRLCALPFEMHSTSGAWTLWSLPLSGRSWTWSLLARASKPPISSPGSGSLRSMSRMTLPRMVRTLRVHRRARLHFV